MVGGSRSAPIGTHAPPISLNLFSILWPERGGSRFGADPHLYNIVVARTRVAFGQLVHPHLFRDAAATTIALDSPEQVRLAGPLLGHRSFATTERYYNLARAAEAARAWHAVLEGMT